MTVPEKNLQTHFRVCNLCEAMCGLEISHNGEKVFSIKGDPKDPFSKGHICPKGAVMGELYEDPDRLRKPLKKTEDGFIEISWEDAFKIVDQNLNKIRKEHGNNSVATYFGNPTVHNYGIMMYIKAYKKALRTQNAFSATSVDQLPHHFAANFMLGSSMLMPIPDIERTDFMLIMGANPIASNGSIMTVAGVAGKLKDIQDRGGQFIVVDPRKTETAKKASQHLFIKPDTDVFFLMSMLHIIIKEEKYSFGHLGNNLSGFEDLTTIAEDYSPESTSDITGIDSSILRELTDRYLSTKKAVIYGRMGVSTQSNGSLCHWLINLLNIITNHFDVPGGAMFTSPAIPLVNAKKTKNIYGRWKSRVRGLPEFDNELPVSVLTEEINTTGKGQIKALITNAGNPVLSTPNGEQLDLALDKLDFMVSIDIYLNETTRHADIILPPTTGLEVDHYDLVFNTFAIRNTVKFSEALFPPKEGQLHDWQIIKKLTAILSHKKMPLFYRLSTPKILLKLGLLTGPYGKLNKASNFFSGLSLRKVKKSVHGIDLGPLKSIFPDRLLTKDKKLMLAPEVFLNQLPELNKKFRILQINNDKTHFKLIGRRHLRSNNSWLHNNEKLMKGKNRCTVMIHEEDALALNIKEAEEVCVSSRVGRITVPAEITNDIMRGVLSIPHGFGHHKKGSKLHVAKTYAGVSVNDLTDHELLDPLTGNAAFSSLEVQIEKV